MRTTTGQALPTTHPTQPSVAQAPNGALTQGPALPRADMDTKTCVACERKNLFLEGKGPEHKKGHNVTCPKAKPG
jgi:hypothetical protein